MSVGPSAFRQYGTTRECGQENQDSPNTQPAEAPRKPDARIVADFHTNADTDVRRESIHHTIGPGPNQASPGSHRHDGGDSALLLEGVTLTGSKGGNVALASVVQALVRLGAEDATT